MKYVIIHYNDNNVKQDLFFEAKDMKQALVILMRETAPEKLWARGWDQKYLWNEVR